MNVFFVNNQWIDLMTAFPEGGCVILIVGRKVLFGVRMVHASGFDRFFARNGRLKFRAIHVLLLFVFCSCARKSILFQGPEGSMVATVNPSDLDKEIKSFGKVPVKMDIPEINGRVVRISKEGFIPHYWFFGETAGDATTVTVKSLPIPTQPQQEHLPLNELIRTVIAAYREIGRGRFEEARSLANQAIAMAPQAATPHALSGVANIKLGKKEEARAAFLKARAIDPSDTEISELMAMLGIQ